jgi:hypothetical protein
MVASREAAELRPVAGIKTTAGLGEITVGGQRFLSSSAGKDLVYQRAPGQDWSAIWKHSSARSTSFFCQYYLLHTDPRNEIIKQEKAVLLN